MPEGTGSSMSGIPDTTVPQRNGQVNVEKAGESVEGPQDHADVELREDVHEVCWTDGSYGMLDSNGNVTKKKILPHCSRRQCGATLRMHRKYLLEQV